MLVRRSLMNTLTSTRKKTSRELADMVASGIGICGVAVVVHRIRPIGWYPTSMTAPAQAIGVELRADQVAKDASGSRWPTIGGIFSVVDRSNRRKLYKGLRYYARMSFTTVET